jgi:hypothetical protein
VELEELKIAWAQLETRVQVAEAQVLSAAVDRKAEASRRVLLGLSWGQAAQIAVWIAVVAVVAPFWIAHRHVPHLLAAGLVLHVYGVAAIVASVVQLLLISRTYATAPVVIYQRRLAEFQRFRAVSALALGLPWWMLWIVATIVGARLWWGVDLYAESPRWIQVSIGIGAAGMALTVWLARLIGRRPPGSAMLRRRLDDLAGHSLVRAARDLDEVRRFERD